MGREPFKFYDIVEDTWRNLPRHGPRNKLEIRSEFLGVWGNGITDCTVAMEMLGIGRGVLDPVSWEQIRVEGREWRREELERDVRRGEMRRKFGEAKWFWGNVRSKRPETMFRGSCYWGKKLEEGIEIAARFGAQVLSLFEAEVGKITSTKYQIVGLDTA
jgi:hypothetical protein